MYPSVQKNLLNPKVGEQIRRMSGREGNVGGISWQREGNSESWKENRIE
jgi:hypothetical protein